MLIEIVNPTDKRAASAVPRLTSFAYFVAWSEASLEERERVILLYALSMALHYDSVSIRFSPFAPSLTRLSSLGYFPFNVYGSCR